MSRYVDEHRGRFGVEPICKTLGVSVSAYYERRNGRRSARAVEDERLLGRIRELHAANYYAYGYRRKTHGIVGAKRRGKPWRTTRPDPQAQRRPKRRRREAPLPGRTSPNCSFTAGTERSASAAPTATTRDRRRANGRGKCHCCAFPWRSGSCVGCFG